MRISLLLFVFICYATELIAQMSTQIGPYSSDRSKAIHQGFVMSDSTSVYSIDYLRNSIRKEQKLYVDVFDKKNHTFINTIDISPIPENDNPLELKEIFSVQQKMVLVMIESQPNDLKRVIMQVIRKNGSREKMVAVDTLPSSQNVSADFEIVVDAKETSFVICTNYPISATENQKLKMTGFQSDLTPKWSKTIVFPQRDKQYLFSDWQYDGEGTIFFLARHIINLYESELEFTTGNQNTYYLWGYNQINNHLKEIELSLNKRFISKIGMTLGQNKWIIGGTYSNDKKFRTDGVFNLLIDQNMQVSSHLIHDFTSDEQRSFNHNSTSNFAERGIDDIRIKSIEVLENEDFVIIGEEYRKDVEEPNDGRMSSSNFTEIFYYNDLSLFWFDREGKLKGNYSIPKTQVSLNDQGYFSSYALGKSGDKLFFFFNDNPKNALQNNGLVTKPKIISLNRKVYLRGVQVNDQGQIRNEVILAPSRNEKTRPVLGVQLMDDRMYFMRQRRRKTALVSVSFED